MLHVWTPKELVDPKEQKEWAGEIHLEVPLYMERMKLMKEMNFKVDNKGEIDTSHDPFGTLIKFGEICQKYAKKVDLVYKKDHKVNNVPDLLSYEECQTVLSAVGNRVVSGAKLSKN